MFFSPHDMIESLFDVPTLMYTSTNSKAQKELAMKRSNIVVDSQVYF